MIFAEGIRFFKPSEKAPKSIKGNMIINLKELLAFAASNNIEDVMKIDLRKSETKGTYYFSLNTWKPTQGSVPMGGIEYPTEVLEDSPF